MSNPSHKRRTKEFRDLTFAEQAKSITAEINNLQSAIKHHVHHSPRPAPQTRDKCLRQIDRLLGRLRSNLPAILLLACVLVFPRISRTEDSSKFTVTFDQKTANEAI